VREERRGEAGDRGDKPDIHPLHTQILENDKNWERQEILIQGIKLFQKYSSVLNTSGQ
jgi:hypothetical protein